MDPAKLTPDDPDGLLGLTIALFLLSVTVICGGAYILWGLW